MCAEDNLCECLFARMFLIRMHNLLYLSQYWCLNIPTFFGRVQVPDGPHVRLPPTCGGLGWVVFDTTGSVRNPNTGGGWLVAAPSLTRAAGALPAAAPLRGGRPSTCLGDRLAARLC